MKIKVLIDLSPVGSRPELRTGLARVALSLARALSCRATIQLKCAAWGSLHATGQFLSASSELADLEYASIRMDWASRHYIRKVLDLETFGKEPSIFWIRIGQVLNRLRNPLANLSSKDFNVIHSTYARLPSQSLKWRISRLITVHDLMPFALPESMFPPGQRAITGRILKSIRKEDWVACVSEHTKKDFLQFTEHPVERCVVIPNGVDLEVFSPSCPKRQTAIRRKFGLTEDEPFLMTLSSLAPHKNLKMLLKLWNERKFGKGRGRFVIAGGRTTDAQSLFRQLGVDGVETDGVIVTGYLTDEDYVDLASACNSFLFPSLYEGFGLPALEAMACGAPVVVASTTSLPEVVGNGGQTLDPSNECLWAEAMEAALLTTPPDCVRLASRRRAEGFSWGATAARYEALYHQMNRPEIR